MRENSQEITIQQTFEELNKWERKIKKRKIQEGKSLLLKLVNWGKMHKEKLKNSGRVEGELTDEQRSIFDVILNTLKAIENMWEYTEKYCGEEAKFHQRIIERRIEEEEKEEEEREKVSRHILYV